MPNKHYEKWTTEDLMDEIIIHAKVGLEASPQAIKEACERIGALSRTGVTKRADRLGKRRLQE